MQTAEHIKDIVKKRYGTVAQQSTSCCPSVSSNQQSTTCCDSGDTSFLAPDYASMEGYYAEADLGLGCGVPTQFADLVEGQTVLDLGSGAGNDVFVTRSLVGESGKVIGVDMTEQMIARAEQNRQKLGYENVEFRLGEIEALPVESNAVDVVISNCVLNLVPDKGRAFQEIYRVLKPGGHFCISDIVLQGELPDTLKIVAELYAGCVAGAMQRDEYLQVIQTTGFTGIEVKREQQFVVTDAILAQYLSQEDIESYWRSNTNIVSITVLGRKPENS